MTFIYFGLVPVNMDTIREACSLMKPFTLTFDQSMRLKVNDSNVHACYMTNTSEPRDAYFKLLPQLGEHVKRQNFLAWTPHLILTREEPPRELHVIGIASDDGAFVYRF